MFEKEIILKEQLAARCHLQCSPARNCQPTLARWIVEGVPVIRPQSNQMHRRERGPERSALSSAMKLAVAGVGKRSKDGARALIDRLTNVHGEGENNDEKEEIDAKQRMQ